MGIGMMKSGIFLFLAVLANFGGFGGIWVLKLNRGCFFTPGGTRESILEQFSLIFKQFLKISKNIFQKNRFSLKTFKKRAREALGPI